MKNHTHTRTLFHSQQLYDTMKNESRIIIMLDLYTKAEGLHNSLASWCYEYLQFIFYFIQNELNAATAYNMHRYFCITRIISDTQIRSLISVIFRRWKIPTVWAYGDRTLTFNLIVVCCCFFCFFCCFRCTFFSCFWLFTLSCRFIISFLTAAAAAAAGISYLLSNNIHLSWMRHKRTSACIAHFLYVQ